MRPTLFAPLIALAVIATPAAAQRRADPLAAAVAAPHRDAKNVARDRYRNPAATLAFFGVKPTDTVVELYPGGGWYTEILAPYLADKGRLIVAPNPGRQTDAIAAKLDSNAAIYGKVVRASFTGDGITPGSVDKVLTFRNVHSWARGDTPAARDEAVRVVFARAFDMLKPGGTLGIVEHRMLANGDPAKEYSSGYVRVATVKRLAAAAGFRYVGMSNVNANPRDTRDYPKGVWTLPPNFAEGDTDRARYEAIGESDRMTLKFVKPRRR